MLKPAIIMLIMTELAANFQQHKDNTWLHLTRMTASNPWGRVIFHLRSLYSLPGSDRAEKG